jgi:hypothetical protein
VPRASQHTGTPSRPGTFRRGGGAGAGGAAASDPPPRPTRLHSIPQLPRPTRATRPAPRQDESYEPTLFTKAFAALTLGLYIGVPQIILTLALLSWWSPVARGLLALVAATAFLPLRPLFSSRVMHSYIFLAWRRYFKFSFVFDKTLAPYDDYVIAQFPHGAFPLGCLVGGTFMATEYPEYSCYALAANNSFFVPIWRHVHTWMGTMAATEKNFRRLLALGTCKGLRSAAERAAKAAGGDAAAVAAAGAAAVAHVGADNAALGKRRASEPSDDGGPNGGDDGRSSHSGSSRSSEASGSPRAAPGSGGAPRAPRQRTSVAGAAAAALGLAGERGTRLRKRNQQGVSVGVMVGGIAEMYLLRPDYECIKLLDRKGFVRIAIEHGANILPVYMFGVSKMMAFGPPWLMSIARRARMSIGVLYGAWGTPIPHRVPLRMAVGVPVDVGPAMQRTDPGFEERVEAVHAAFVEAIKKVYYTHREAYGWGDRPLVVV